MLSLQGNGNNASEIKKDTVDVQSQQVQPE